MSVIQELPPIHENLCGWPWTQETDSSIYLVYPLWPKITIITPSFNQGKFIEETIRSIILQNYPNLEFILIDGGSGDETNSIINKYSQWIDFSVSEKDKGQSDAINKGLRRATGEIVNWINSDDLLVSGGLFSIGKAFIEHPAADFVSGGTEIIAEGHASKLFDKSMLRDELSNLYAFPHPQMSSFYRMSIVRKIGLVDESLRFSMDYDLFVRIYLNGSMIEIPALIAQFRVHQEAKSSTIDKIRIEDDKRIFSRILNTFAFARPIALFKEIGLYQESEGCFSTNRSFSESDVVLCLHMFLRRRIYELGGTVTNLDYFILVNLLKTSGIYGIFDHHLKSVHRKMFMKALLGNPIRTLGHLMVGRRPPE